jgi:hypothetical protein
MKVHLELLRISAAVVPATLLLAGLWNPQRCGAQQAAISADSASATVATTIELVAPTGPAARRAENEELRAKAARHGIRIHGHWVIDVKNPDGKLVEHREFENSLVTVGTMMSGDQLLAGLLSGNLTAGDPGIGLVQGTPGTDPSASCNTFLTAQLGNSLSPNTTCFGLTTAASGMASYLANFTTGLTSTVTFSPAVKWVLSGNYTAPATLTSISAVQTLVATCFKPDPSFVKESGFTPNGVSTTTGTIQFAGTTSLGRSADLPSGGCVENYSPPAFSQVILTSGGIATLDDFLDFTTFTSTKLSTPLAVSAGQVITVTVTISFT